MFKRTEIEMPLVYSEAKRASWTRLPFESRLAIASLKAVEANQAWIPELGKLSTITTHYIRNAFANCHAKEKTRQKYDGIQASTLLPSQIPAADTPNAERAVVFFDSLNHLSEDAQFIVNKILNTDEIKDLRLKSIQTHMIAVCGWTQRQWVVACNEIKSLWA